MNSSAGDVPHSQAENAKPDGQAEFRNYSMCGIQETAVTEVAVVESGVASIESGDDKFLTKCYRIYAILLAITTYVVGVGLFCLLALFSRQVSVTISILASIVETRNMTMAIALLEDKNVTQGGHVVGWPTHFIKDYDVTVLGLTIVAYIVSTVHYWPLLAVSRSQERFDLCELYALIMDGHYDITCVLGAMCAAAWTVYNYFDYLVLMGFRCLTSGVLLITTLLLHATLIPWAHCVRAYLACSHSDHIPAIAII